MKAKIILLSLFLSGAYFSLFSTTYYVRSSSGSDAYRGLTSGEAFQTLTKVFSGTPALVDGDTIDISGTFDYYVSKVLTKSIVIQGTDKSTAIIQGLAGSATRCFGIGDGTLTPAVTFENITFQNFDNYTASGSQVGGAINVFAGASLTCRNVNFINNRAYIGGAVNIVSGVANFEDCYFYNNRTTRAGSVNSDGGAVNVSISTGSISLTLNRCLFEGNSTQNIASALRFKSTTTGSTGLLVQNSTFTGNAVVSPSSSTTSGAVLIDVTSSNADIKLINNTIAYNTTVVTGSSTRAGLSILGADDKLVLINNILYSNTNGSNANISISASYKMKECRNNITNQAYNFDTNTTVGMASNNVSSVTAGNLALAAALADNGGATKTLTIGANSVAKNTGYTSGTALVDQRNFTRIGNPDVGAYEYITFYRSKTSGSWSETTSWESSTDNANWIDATVTPASTDGTISISNGNEITINTSSTASDININAGGKLTLNSGYTLDVAGNFSIQSAGTNGTGTFVDKNSTGGLTVNGITNVKQYITSSGTGLTGRNWYISSPLSAATSSTITTATGNGLVYYNVGGAIWDNAGATMDVMKGYVAKSPAQSTTITFSGGNLNTGSQSVSNLPLGFNLVGNPYPSFVNWTDAIKTNVSNSIWYRSKKTGSYNFHTYNVTGGVGVNDGTDIIPPMQSFWIKTTSATNSLEFTNAMRSHQDQSVVANRLMAPKVNTQKLLRLQVSNGTNIDETVVYFNPNAQDSKDDFDSQKMFNNITNVPEIYTVIESDKFAINGMNDIPYNSEIPLGFNSLENGMFTLKISECKNLEHTKIFLRDNVLKNEYELTDGVAHNFESEITNGINRFRLIFRVAATTTKINDKIMPAVKVFTNTANQITIVSPEKLDYRIYNTLGKLVSEGKTILENTVVDNIYESGVYVVKVSNLIVSRVIVQ